MTDDRPWLLTVDPGKRGCGCALWFKGQLREAGYVAPRERAATLSGAVETMAGSVQAWALELTRGELRDNGQLVVELPQTYGGRAEKGDANTLIALGCVVGAIIGSLGCPASITVPHGWKKSIPKPETKGDYDRDGYIVEGRALAALRPSEVEAVVWPTKGSWKLRMDVADSLGIGLWALQRAFI
jgi:hypothetical protein